MQLAWHVGQQPLMTCCTCVVWLGFKTATRLCEYPQQPNAHALSSIILTIGSYVITGYTVIQVQ
jgi:hypothetical protein